MPTVFISYRRADSAASAGRVYDRLVERYGRAAVFKDVDSIPPGVNFADYIAQSIATSDVTLVIIGPGWLSASTGFAKRRLDDPADFVRVEIETALRLGVAVIPLLVEGASLPPARRLPESLRPLLRQNGLALRQDPDFTRDLERVYAAIDYWQAQPRRPLTPPAPAEPAAPATRSATNSAAAPAQPTPATVATPRPHAPATALAERIGIAASRRTTRTRPNVRLSSLLTLDSALVVIAVAVGLLESGAAAKLLANARGASGPDVQATQTAHAEATFGARLAQTASAQAQEVMRPYQPKGIAACDSADPVYNYQSSPYYWSWTPAKGVTCSGGTTTRMTVENTGVNYASVSFWGFPYLNSGFQSAFTSSMSIAFTGDEPGNDKYYCALITVGIQGDPVNNGARTLTICRDGSWSAASAHSTSGTLASGATAQLAIQITVTASTVGISANGQPLMPPAKYEGSISNLDLQVNALPPDGLTVTGFKLIPTAA